ncbi:hypothetical protein Bbelb_163150 [Branchiostoma belcheri]|nr:hypothetical protein Bbelb_163150 [Branchiostoma belcheri]
MFLCVLWDLSVFLSIFLENLLSCVPVFQEDLPVCVPEGPVTYLRDKRTPCQYNADPETGLQQEEEPDFCRQGCVKEDGFFVNTPHAFRCTHSHFPQSLYSEGLDAFFVWEADAVYLTMWDLSMLLCVLWDLSAILCTCPGGPVCVPVGPVHRITFQEDLCSCLFQEDVPVFLRDLSPLRDKRTSDLTNLA